MALTDKLLQPRRGWLMETMCGRERDFADAAAIATTGLCVAWEYWGWEVGDGPDE